jgi:hypothetical protein
MKKVIPLFLFLLTPLTLRGQFEKILNPADLKQQTVITEPLSLNKGFLRVGLFYSYSCLDKYFDTSGEKNYFPESTWGSASGSSFWVQYGITDRIMVETGISYSSDLKNYHSKLFAPGLDTMVIRNSSVRGKGLGDITLSGTYQIIPSKSVLI